MTPHSERPAQGPHDDLPEGLEVLPLAQCALLLRPDDDVAVTTRELAAGTRLRTAERLVVLLAEVPRGHKLAVRDLPAGSTVHKYGQSIGRATADIAAGAHV
ncbi:MAG TPA: UxaA family hydrolase, partial [Dermatophilaceae bacterium]